MSIYRLRETKFYPIFTGLNNKFSGDKVFQSEKDLDFPYITNDFRFFRSADVVNLMYVKEDLIIPHVRYSFFALLNCKKVCLLFSRRMNRPFQKLHHKSTESLVSESLL